MIRATAACWLIVKGCAGKVLGPLVRTKSYNEKVGKGGGRRGDSQPVAAGQVLFLAEGSKHQAAELDSRLLAVLTPDTCKVLQ